MSDVFNHGELGIIALKSSEKLGNLVNDRIKALRNITDPDFTYLVPHEQVRFNNGEGKIKLLDTVRGKDIYVIADVGNYSCSYTMFGYTNPTVRMSTSRTSSASFPPSAAKQTASP